MAQTDNNWHPAEAGYRSFLLRCWREGDPDQGEGPGQGSPWRFALRELGDEPVKKGFASLEDLKRYLQTELEGEPSMNKASTGG